MLFDRLYDDDGAMWRVGLQEAYQPRAVAAARLCAKAALADGADPVDVTMCLWAAALRDRDPWAAREAEQDFLALHARRPPSLKSARQLFAIAVEIVERQPRTGPIVRAIEAALTAANVAVEELVSSIDGLDDDEQWAASYVTARLRLRAAGGARASTTLVQDLAWAIVRGGLHRGGGARRDIVSSLIMQMLRRADFDDCGSVDRIHQLARWLGQLGPPPGTRWASFTSADAAPLLRRVLDHWQGHHCARDELNASIVLTDLAAVVREHDPAAAEDLYRNSMIVARRVEGDGRQLQVTESHLAGLLVDVGRFAEAVEILTALIPRRTALLGRASEGVYVSSVRLASAVFGLGRLDEAERVARDALAISQEARLMSFEIRAVLGDILEAKGRLDEADVVRDWSRAREALTC